MDSLLFSFRRERVFLEEVSRSRISWLAAKFTVSFSRRTLLHGLRERERKWKQPTNWWIKAPAVLSETTSRGKQNPERRYKLLGHVLFQNAHARCYSCYVCSSKESSGSQRNQTFHNRANSIRAFNTDHDYQKIINESFRTSFHCIKKNNSTQTQSVFLILVNSFSYCISLQSYRSVQS
jgi:hypothetical protein